MTLQAQIKWVDNIADFKKHIEEGTNGVVAHTAKVDKLTQSLGGSGLLGAANNYVAAVEKMGGVERLTAAEKERINGLVVKALEKYEALGREAPEAMRRLADATKATAPPLTQTETLLDKIWSGLKSAAGLVGLAFSAQAVIGFVGRVFDAASKIHDVAAALDISTDAAQRYKYAAEQSGATMDDVASSINFMNKSLSEGDKGTVGALNAAGLSFSAIRNMRPEDAFDAITEAVKGIPDPMLRAEVRTQLLGKASKALAAGIDDGFTDIGKAATIMSKDTIDSLEKAQDAWGKLADRVTIISGSLIAHAMNTATQVTSSWKSFLLFADNVIKHGVGAATAMADSMDQATRATSQNKDTNLAAEGPLRKTKEQLEAAAKAAAAHAKEIQGITDKLSGNGAIKQAKEYLEALNKGLDIHKLTADAQADVNKVMAEAIAVYTAQGRVAPEAMRLLYIETLKLPPAVYGAGAAFKDLGQHVDVSIPKMAKWGVEVRNGIEAGAKIGTTVEITVPKVKKLDDGIGALSKSLSQMATIAGDSMGSVVRNIGSLVSAYDTALKAQETFSKGLEAFNKGDTLQGIAGMAAGVMGIVSAAMQGVQAVKALWNAIAGTAGRDAVEAFVKSFGGFDAIHAKLLTLGAAGEALWIKLTQGVGRNNPEQAKAVIAEINAAFGAQTAQMERLAGVMERYGLSWEDAGLKAKQSHLDEIARGLIQDFADLSVAGFDVTLITEKMSGAINDYVHLAMRTGTEIPSAMKPLLQKMLELGTLTDDAGVKMTDLEGLSFAETLTEGFKSVVEAIKELAKALGGDLGGALDALSRKKVVIPIGFEVPDDPTGAKGAETFHNGTARVLAFPIVAHNGLLPDEVPAILQTGEAVLNRRAAAAIGTHAIGALNRGDRPAGRNDARVDVLERELLAQRAASDANFERLMTALPKLVKAAAQQGKAA